MPALSVGAISLIKKPKRWDCPHKECEYMECCAAPFYDAECPYESSRRRNGMTEDEAFQIIHDSARVVSGYKVTPTFEGIWWLIDALAALGLLDLNPQALAPTNDAPLRLCGMCHTWNSKPCGNQCGWSPSDPTVSTQEDI